LKPFSNDSGWLKKQKSPLLSLMGLRKKGGKTSLGKIPEA
jgi:hypothetical protein